MPKVQKQDMMNQVYRQFSRQKYNKYKHQFPKMRESEIVSKIIKEWDSMDNQGKQKLKGVYYTNQFIHAQDASEADSAQKSVDKVKIQIVGLDKTADRPKSLKVECKEEIVHGNQGEKEGQSEPQSSKKSYNSSLVTPSIKPKKRNNKEYIAFYKYYFQKHRKQHKNWSSRQVSEVVALLWQKRKKQVKRVLPKKKSQSKLRKPICGRKLFKKINKLSTVDLKSKWTQLPKESRLLWSNPDKSFPNVLTKVLGKMVFKSTPNFSNEKPLQDRPLAFLSKLIT